jgi:nicotinamide mononucleotide (NMN) deamidase PncC
MEALTDIPGSSQWFECGYVTYSNAAKIRDLGVAGATLRNQKMLGAIACLPPWATPMPA